MANIFDKFLDSMKLYDDDETEDNEEILEEEEEEDEEEELSETKRERSFRGFRKKSSEIREEEEDEEEEEEPAEKSSRSAYRRAAQNSNVVAMRSSTSRGTVMEVSMVKPTAMEDARDICDMLLSGRVVVINMEGVQVDLAQRIIDFTSGSCYSIDGNLQKISSFIFIVSPNNIELSGDFTDMLTASSSELRINR